METIPPALAWAVASIGLLSAVVLAVLGIRASIKWMGKYSRAARKEAEREL